MLHDQKIDDIVCEKFNITAKKPNLNQWKKITELLDKATQKIDIAFVGKYVDLTESYKSLTEALIHAGIHKSTKIKIHFMDSEEIENKGISKLKEIDAILRISNVHFGIVKSTITLVFSKALSVLASGLIPLNFLLIILFSVSATSLKLLLDFEDLISC